MGLGLGFGPGLGLGFGSEQPRRGEGAAEVAAAVGLVRHGWQRASEAGVARLREDRRPGLGLGA